jgi:hypothetical protein
LFWVAVLGPAVLVVIFFLPSSAVPLWLVFSSLHSGGAAIMLLCIWCAVYAKDEPRLVRIALIWIALLFLSVTIGVPWAASTPRIGETKKIRVRADIHRIRTMLLSFNETNGYYPNTEQGLQALVPRFLEEVPKDAWGHITFTVVRENATRMLMTSFPPGLIAWPIRLMMTGAPSNQSMELAASSPALDF